MPAYLISYDLRKVRNYDALVKSLRQWSCVSPLKSVWLGQLRGPASTIRDVLRQHMDGDDGLLIVELKQGSDWATYRVNEAASGWLQRNVAP